MAVDVPSGIDVDTGNVEGRAVHADVTVTFGVLKPGLLVGAGAVHSGLVELVDIGLTPWLRGSPALLMPTLEAIQANWPRPDDRRRQVHARRRRGGDRLGHVPGGGGAVGHRRAGRPGRDGPVRRVGGRRRAAAAPSVIATGRVADAGRVQAWVCGSGLGTDERAAAEVRSVLAASVPVCLDADALNLLVDGSMSGLLRERSAPIVVTPHDREYQRLAGHPPGGDRVADALELATRMRAVVLLKGNRTIVATPDGRAYVNPTGSPALATGGTGDVLAGILGSLLAGGLAPEVAAISAAYVHGLAGRLAGADGPVTALDVAERLRSAVRLLWES